MNAITQQHVIVPSLRLARPRKAAPDPARKLVIAAGKGGVGKTQVAREVAFRAAGAGLATLLLEVEYNTRLLHTVAGISTYAGESVDNNSTIWGVITKPQLAGGIAPFQLDMGELRHKGGMGRMSAQDRSVVVARWRWQTPQVLEYISGSKSLRSLDNPVFLASASAQRADFDPQTQLTQGLDILAQRYDLIVIDTPPVTGLVQRNAIAACADAQGRSGVVIVADFDIDTIEDVTRTRDFINDVVSGLRANSRPAPRVLGVVYNKYDEGEEIDRELLEAYRHGYDAGTGSNVMQSALIGDLPELGVLRFDKAIIKRADRNRLPISVQAPLAGLTDDYARLTDTLLRALDLDRYVAMAPQA